MPDSSIYLTLDQAKYFNFQVDDVDKAQAIEGLMSALMEEASRGLAEVEDSFIAAQLALNAGGNSASAQIATEQAAADAVDAAFVYLWNNGVSRNDKVTIYLAPWFYNLFKNRLVALKTDNDSLISNGKVGMYNNATVKMSNNIYNDGTDDCMIIKTSKAYAFCNGISETEAYRPHDLFSDAVKGLDTYGGKMVRPKECYCIKAHQ